MMLRQGFHKVERFVKAPSRWPSPDLFLRLLRRRKGEKREFWAAVAALRPPLPKAPKTGSNFVKILDAADAKSDCMIHAQQSAEKVQKWVEEKL